MLVNPVLLQAWKQFFKSRDEALILDARNVIRFNLTTESNDINSQIQAIRAKNNGLLTVKGEKLVTKRDELNTLCHGLTNEIRTLCTQAMSAWLDAVIQIHGEDITVEWTNSNYDLVDSDCLLGNGEIYTVSMGRK